MLLWRSEALSHLELWSQVHPQEYHHLDPITQIPHLKYTFTRTKGSEHLP